MSRRLLGCTIAIVLLPSLTPAQNSAAPAQILPIRPVMSTPFPGNTAGYVGAVVGGGQHMPYLDLSTGRITYPTVFYAAPWPGGFITPNGLYVPYGVAIGEFLVDAPDLGSIPQTPLPERVVELSGEYPAILTLEFPAVAKVWLNGQPVAGKASKERVLTSPVLKPGQQYTFKIRARWDAGGKTYEYSRELTLENGDRSKLLVVSGSSVADNGKR
jgi:uncharacterized protein (TIGR03000 family)